jgi:hypothetical protein
MKVSIDVEIDISNALEQRFLEFYQTQPSSILKSILMCGFLMVEEGVSTYYDEKYKSEVDSVWKGKLDKMLLENTHLQEEMSFLRSVYEDRYARMYESRLQAKDDEMKRMQEDFGIIKDAQLKQVVNRCTQLEEELGQMQNKYQESLREEVRSKLVERMEFETRLQEEYRRCNEELKHKCQRYEEEYKNALNKSADYAMSCMQDMKVCELEKEVSRLKTELQCFKSSNIYKGQHGEKVIRDILAEHFTNCEIVDTSKTGGLSDVHLITDGGDMFVFESKNKASISQQDIEKSYDDMELLNAEYGDRLKGYVFVSHRTKNIPKKGHLHIEQRGNMYIAWIGVNENEVKYLEVYLVTVLRLIMSIETTNEQDRNKVDIANVINTLKEKIGLLTENMKICGTLQDSIAGMALSLNNLQNNNKELYDSILSMSGLTNGENASLKRKDHSVRPKLQCSHCGMIFKRKCDLTQHLNKSSCLTH